MYAWGFGIIAVLLAARLIIIDATRHQLPNGTVVLLLAATVGVVFSSGRSPWVFLGGVCWWLLIAVLPRIHRRAWAAPGDQKLALSLGTLAVLYAPWGWFIAVGISGVIGTVMLKSFANAAHGPGMIVGTAVAVAATAVVGVCSG